MFHAAHTLEAGKVKPSDSHNFQTLSSPQPKMKRFTLSSTKAVLIAFAEHGPATKKLPYLPVTIATPKELGLLPLPAILPHSASR